MASRRTASADRSEYRGCYGLSADALLRWHRPRFEVLADEGADVLALEIIPDVDEAEALMRLVGESGVAFALAADAPAVVAVGIN